MTLPPASDLPAAQLPVPPFAQPFAQLLAQPSAPSPVRRLRPLRHGAGAALLAGLTALASCASTATATATATGAAGPDTQAKAVAQALPGPLEALTRAQVLLVGEQHDAPEHQQIQAQLVQQLADRGQLAALVLEMAPSGGGTQGLPTASDEAAVRQALRWDDGAWPWARYGPAVMAAVRAGVPVLGGNLPRQELRPSMSQAALDQRLPAAALQRQQQLIREGHCNLLPDSQIGPMTRVQIARDLRMAQTLDAALPLARPGQLVLLIAGSVHADRQLGVPLHLPPQVRSLSLRLQAGGQQMAGEQFDLRWPTPPVPPVDYCAGLAERFKARTQPPAAPATAPASTAPTRP